MSKMRQDEMEHPAAATYCKKNQTKNQEVIKKIWLMCFQRHHDFTQDAKVPGFFFLLSALTRFTSRRNLPVSFSKPGDSHSFHAVICQQCRDVSRFVSFNFCHIMDVSQDRLSENTLRYPTFNVYFLTSP